MEGIPGKEDLLIGQPKTETGDQQKGNHMTDHTKTIFAAAQNGDGETMRRLIESPVSNMAEQDDHGSTALFYGVQSGNLETVRYLTERVGLSPVAGNRDGKTPWDTAWEMKQEEILSYFAERMGYSYEESYHNPIRHGFFPDPSIVRVGEDYYMVNSTFVFFPCIPVSHSRDLIHWEVIGHAITEPEYARLEGLHGGMGYWAPDISYSDGRFYVTATLRLNDGQEKKRFQMVTSAARPEGPYEPPVFLDIDGIDPSIFHDDDGRKYMLVNKGARIVELSHDCRRMISPVTMLWYGDCRRTPEGPHMLKYQGYYYLFLAEGGTGKGHRITVARSKTLMGPYEPSPYNPILRQWDECQQIQCCGHGKPFQMADGRWGIVYLCLRMLEGKYGILGRETSLDPLSWTADGWPIVNKGRGPSQQQKLPMAGESDRGDKKAAQGRWTGYPKWKNRIWMTPRPLPAAYIQLAGEGTEEGKTVSGAGSGEDSPLRLLGTGEDGPLRLLGTGEDLCSTDCRSILVERQDSFRFEAICELQIPSLKEGQSLGITCYYDENSYIKYGVGFQSGAYGIWLQEYVGDGYINRKVHPLDMGGMENGDVLRIRCKVKTDRLARIFSYSLTDRETSWIQTDVLTDTSYLSSEGLSKGKRFTGAAVGIYVQGGFWGTFTDWDYKVL